MERRLAAIVAIDIVGYSRLMNEDEEGTHLAVKDTFKSLIDPKVAQYHDRSIKLTGDGALLEFASAVDAVVFAVEMQCAMRERNRDVPEKHRIEYRVGINIGDIIIEPDDIYGDGVNIAARLEGLAEPGGICVSRTVFDHVRNKVDLGFEDLGEKQVKNIPEPVGVYHVVLDAKAAALITPLVREAAKPKRRRWPVAAAAVVAVLLVTVGGTLWWRPWAQEQVFQSSPLSTRASIAVLPFSNLSTDPNQEYFSDGVTNDIITDLSKFHDLFVISSNSTFVYKGKLLDISQVGQELGVRYVLKGSVQRDDMRVRINVQLIDVKTGQHLWADRYDEAIDNIFDLQDRITKRIVQTLAIRLTDIELKRISAKPTSKFAAYDYLLKGRALVANLTRKDGFEARKMFRRAINLDPSYASAYSSLGFTYILAVVYGWAVSPNQALAKALKLAQHSLKLDGSDVVAHRLLGRLYVFRKQYDLAVLELERAIALNPSNAGSYADQGLVLVWSSRSDGAILALKTALRLDPNMGEEGLFHLGLAYYLKGRYEDAILNLKRSNVRNPNLLLTHVVLAAVYGQINNSASASRATAAIRRLDPFFSVEGFGELFKNRDDAAKVIDGLRKAGLK